MIEFTKLKVQPVWLSTCLPTPDQAGPAYSPPDGSYMTSSFAFEKMISEIIILDSRPRSAQPVRSVRCRVHSPFIQAR